MSSESAAPGTTGDSDHAEISGEQFRDALARWASGVTIVTASGVGQEPVGMTASSFAALSLQPPLVLVCIAHDAQSHDDLIGAPGFFVHVLSRGQEELSRSFAAPGRAKFDALGTLETGRFGAPLLPIGVARLACAHHASVPLGDHTVLSGRVVGSEVTDADPLLYAHRDYHGLG